MRIVMTLKELRNECDKYGWEKACAVFGLNPFCLNEGADENTRIQMSKEQAVELGIIKG